MLSWETEGKSNRSGSLRSTVGLSDSARTGSLRKSVDYPASSRSSMDHHASPTGSLPKSHGSMLRSSAGGAPHTPHIPEVDQHDTGKIGADGWWHNMDHGHLNERPEADDKPKDGAKTTAFAPQFGVTGMANHYGSIFKDEEPAAPAASVAAQPASPAAAAVPQVSSPVAVPLPAAIAARSEPVAAASPSKPSAMNDGSVQDAVKKAGWWTQMDNSILNAPPEEDGPNAAKKGSSFAPQFALPGMGNRYKSIFDEDQPAAPPTEEMNSWAPFDAGKAASGACAPQQQQAADDDWEPFKSAVPTTSVN